MFPIYFKYVNRSVYFKIIGETEFEEVQVVGSKVFVHHTIAKQFPEKLFIQDMIANEEGRYEKVDAQSYEQVKNRNQ